MTPRRSESEIDAEITALRQIRPQGFKPWPDARMIELTIHALRPGFDTTTLEWERMTHDQQEVAIKARAWAECVQEEKPSVFFRETRTRILEKCLTGLQQALLDSEVRGGRGSTEHG